MATSDNNDALNVRHRARMLRKKAVVNARIAAATDVRDPSIGLVLLDKLNIVLGYHCPDVPITLPDLRAIGHAARRRHRTRRAARTD